MRYEQYLAPVRSPRPACVQAATHPAVAHAMRVRTLAGRVDASGLCRLYAAAPGLGRALLDLMLPRARFSALKTLAGAYMAPLPVALLAGLLGFCARGASVHSVQQLFEADEGRTVLPGCTRRVFPGKFAPAVRAPACRSPVRLVCCKSPCLLVRPARLAAVLTSLTHHNPALQLCPSCMLRPSYMLRSSCMLHAACCMLRPMRQPLC